MTRQRRQYVSHIGMPISARGCVRMEEMMRAIVELLLDEGEPRRLPMMYEFTVYWARWSFYMAQLDGDAA